MVGRSDSNRGHLNNQTSGLVQEANALKPERQRIQLASTLYQDAGIYPLDVPFSAVEAHTEMNLLNEHVMSALSRKTVLLMTHQVDSLPVLVLFC